MSLLKIDDFALVFRFFIKNSLLCYLYLYLINTLWMEISTLQAKHKKTLITSICVILAVGIIASLFAFPKQFGVDLKFLGLDEPEETPHVNFQMGQAVAPCEEAIEDNVRGETLNKTFDNMSSRYDPSRNEYMIFYSLDNKSRFGSMRSFHILCRISASTNRLKDFEIVTSTAD